MRTEAQANDALQSAARRIEWEGAHMDAWVQPAPVRQRKQRTAHRADYVIAALLACAIMSLALGVL